MEDQEGKTVDPLASGSLDQFVLDEPWKPVSYFNEEDEVSGEPVSNVETVSMEEKNFSDLFQLNMCSIQNDIQKVRSASIDHNDVPVAAHPVYDPNETDEDSINKYISHEETGEHLPVLDSTVRINQKSIEGDMERLRRFRLASVDEGMNEIDLTSGYISNDLQNINSLPKVEKSDGKDEDQMNQENKAVDEILNLLPDIDSLLHDSKLSDVDKNGLNKKNEGSIDQDIMDILNFPEIPTDPLDDMEGKGRDEEKTMGDDDPTDTNVVLSPSNDNGVEPNLTAEGKIDTQEQNQSGQPLVCEGEKVSEGETGLALACDDSLNEQKDKVFHQIDSAHVECLPTTSCEQQKKISMGSSQVPTSECVQDLEVKDKVITTTHLHDFPDDNDHVALTTTVTTQSTTAAQSPDGNGDCSGSNIEFLAPVDQVNGDQPCTLSGDAQTQPRDNNDNSFSEVCQSLVSTTEVQSTKIDSGPSNVQQSMENTEAFTESVANDASNSEQLVDNIVHESSQDVAHGNREEITSALIADILLAEANKTSNVESNDEVGENSAQGTITQGLSSGVADNVTSAETAPLETTSDEGSEVNNGVGVGGSVLGNQRGVNGDNVGDVHSPVSGSGSVQEEISESVNASAERPRQGTATSNGSEDLEEFIRDQYHNSEGDQGPATEGENQEGAAQPVQQIDPGSHRLGSVPPKWVPDKDAKMCMLCDVKFTVVKRRHHCRACGKVLCAGCCNMKFNLPYMNFKPARVCQVCCDTMIRAQNALPLPTGPTTRVQTVPTIPELYDSDGQVSPSPQNQSFLPPTTESPPSYQQSTTFQGPLVGGTGATVPGGPLGQSFYPINRNTNSRIRTESEVSAVIMFNSTQTNLPPVIRESNGVIKIVNSPELGGLFEQIHDKDQPPVVFLVNKNLIVRLKIVHLDCCVGKICWCFCTDGMGASNQEEIVVVNEYYGDDVSAIKCVLQQFNSIFEKAKQGNSVGDLGCVTFNSQMLLNPNLTSMLFFKASLQCTQNLIKPSSPFLFGHYLHSNEVSWGKVFPMRVFLRLGYEYKSYPCPIYNDLNREALYSAGGRTIVNLLADLRNYQYSIQKITGVLILLKNKDIIVRLPQNRYDEVLKLVNTAEDHVLCFGGNFTTKADSYLVAVESDSGFTTQTVHMAKKSRKATLASFIVFSASLKPSQDEIVAKTSIVEDGIMVQITADFMKAIRVAVKDMRDHSVSCGPPDSGEGKLIIEWTTGEPSERSRHKSPIDGMTLDNLTNMKIRHSYDYSSSTNPCKIHWMEVYFLPNDGNTVDRLSARELGQMTSSVAKACMEALRPHLGTLCELKMNWIGLRVSLDSDTVEYKIGSNLQTLPYELTADLDDKLIPAIHGVMSNLPQGKIQVELIFQVVRIV